MTGIEKGQTVRSVPVSMHWNQETTEKESFWAKASLIKIRSSKIYNINLFSKIVKKIIKFFTGESCCLKYFAVQWVTTLAQQGQPVQGHCLSHKNDMSYKAVLPCPSLIRTILFINIVLLKNFLLEMRLFKMNLIMRLHNLFSWSVALELLMKSKKFQVSVWKNDIRYLDSSPRADLGQEQ